MIKSEYLDMSKLLKSQSIYKLFQAVEEQGGTLRFVGGAVRDTLKGLERFDLDLATDLSPDELVEACLAHRLKTIPVGLKSATTGVVIDNQIVEVSSLQEAYKTESGKIETRFTDDWSVDASRRDLTINAVYADLRGNVFDYYNGIDDLENGNIRFIGNPDDRIKEDYLRIMRFFRFYSLFGKGSINKAALKACIANKDGLRSISIERVRDELFKLLVTPNIAEVLKIIFDNNILSFFLPKPKHFNALQRLTDLVADMNYEGNFLRRLFVLYQPNSVEAENMANTLRFTKKQKETFINWAKIDLAPINTSTKELRLRFIYRYGKAFLIDKIFLTMSIYKVENTKVEEVLKEIEDTVVPIFPLRGRDIVNLGIKADKKVGKILGALEQRWIDSSFTLTRDELLDIIRNKA